MWTMPGSASTKLKSVTRSAFNKYFYQHTSLRSLEEVTAEILALEQETERAAEKVGQFWGGRMMERLPRYQSYRDSGVEWLGVIPSHWDVRRIKSFALVKRGASPRPIADPRYFDDQGEYGWVRIETLPKAENI